MRKFSLANDNVHVCRSTSDITPLRYYLPLKYHRSLKLQNERCISMYIVSLCEGSYYVAWLLRQKSEMRPKLYFTIRNIIINPFPNKPWFLRVCSISLLKHCGKRINCSLRAISPFPTLFSTR